MTLLRSNRLAPRPHLPGYGHRSDKINSKSDLISNLSTVTSFRLGMMLEISVASLEG